MTEYNINMRHNVNFGLLGLLLVVILCMIGLVIYYYLTYANLSQRYDEALTDLENVSVSMNQTRNELQVREDELKAKEDALIKYMADLNMSKQRETSLGGQFTELETEAKKLELNLEATESEKARYAQLYNRYYSESIEFREKYQVASEQLTTEKSRVSALKDGLSTILNDAGLIISKISTIEGQAQQIQNKGNSTTDPHAKNIKDEANYIKNYATSIQDQINTLKNA
jgi:chromosome segregation ATPase